MRASCLCELRVSRCLWMVVYVLSYRAVCLIVVYLGRPRLPRYGRTPLAARMFNQCFVCFAILNL